MPTQVLFIGGSGRSGTTILSRAIGQIPGYVAVGEVREIWRERLGQNRLCGCGAAFLECPFWEAVGEAAFGGWSQVDRDDAEAMVGSLTWLDAVRHLRSGATHAGMFPPSTAALLARLYEGISTVADGATVVDTSKGPPYGVALGTVPGIEVRAVHVIRDSRGIAHSWAKEVPAPYTPGHAVRTHKLTAVSSTRWIVHNVVMEMLSRRGRHARARYESFVHDPRGELVRIMRDLGQPIDASELDFVGDGALHLSVDHTVAGNPNRHSTGDIPLRLDAAWQTSLPALVRFQVTALTWPLLLRYGYPLSRSPAAATGSRSGVDLEDDTHEQVRHHDAPEGAATRPERAE